MIYAKKPSKRESKKPKKAKKKQEVLECNYSADPCPYKLKECAGASCPVFTAAAIGDEW